MYTVYLNNKGEGHSYQTFYETMVEICLAHQQEDRALAFAFILYDFRDAHISKVLNDVDYWRSLDQISGKYLTVFSFHYEPEARDKKRPSAKENVVYKMVAVKTTENLSTANDELLDRYFGDISIKFPAMLFFQVKKDKIIDYAIVELEKENIEAAFNELKKYIKEVVNTLKLVTEKGNSEEIFGLVKDKLGYIKGVSSLVKIGSTALRVATSLATFLKLLAKYNSGKI